MNKIVVSVSNISKLYQMNKFHYESFKEATANYFKSIISGKKNTPALTSFWALKDISFELEKGDALGIIGRNGSGKSTLLKILSEVTEPTEGKIELNGKVASILEIGMGFNTDLTGRENVFLSGSMLGMNRQEIKKHLNDIIKFSEIEKFIDTPVKHYSSGMYVRLAFSIVAHISADILLFDEVLSAGDAAFRIKSLRRINSLIKEGKTILIATHNLGEVVNFCNKAIILEDGKIKQSGDPLVLISDYKEDTHNSALNGQNANNNEGGSEKKKEEEERINNSRTWHHSEESTEDTTARFHQILVKARGKKPTDKLYSDELLDLEFYFWNPLDGKRVDIAFMLKDSADYPLLASATLLAERSEDSNAKGLYRASCEISANFLNPGFFVLDVFLLENRKDTVYKLQDALSFRVHFAKGKTRTFEERLTSPLKLITPWDLSKVNHNAI